MIKERELELKRRPGPAVRAKYNSSGSTVVNERKMLYKYYVCDYCKEEIEIKENKQDQTGGTLVYRGMELALHNKCLKPVLKEFE